MRSSQSRRQPLLISTSRRPRRRCTRTSRTVISRAPTNRNEEYRFTDFSALTAAEFEGPKDGAKADASGTRVEDAGVVGDDREARARTREDGRRRGIDRDAARR